MKQDINIIPVVQGEQAFKVNESELPDVLPVVTVRLPLTSKNPMFDSIL